MNEETMQVIKAAYEWIKTQERLGIVGGAGVFNLIHYVLDSIDFPRGIEREQLIQSFNKE